MNLLPMLRVLFLMPFDYKKMQTRKQFLVIHSVGTVRAFFFIFLYLYVIPKKKKKIRIHI